MTTDQDCLTACARRGALRPELTAANGPARTVRTGPAAWSGASLALGAHGKAPLTIDATLTTEYENLV